jgi:putative transcriptional regulator
MSTKAKSKAKPQTASRVLETVYETAADLERLGFIDKRKMQKLDALCMEPIAPYDSAQIRALREQHNLSQTVMATVLNTSASTVRKWEIGEKHPSGPSLKSLMASPNSPTRGHPKFPQAARSDYDASAWMAKRAAASLSL